MVIMVIHSVGIIVTPYSTYVWVRLCSTQGYVVLPKAPSSILTGVHSDPHVRGDNKFILHHEISVCV